MLSEPTETYAYFIQAIEEIQQKRSRGEWPTCRYPPGKLLLQRYVQQLREGKSEPSSTTSILYVEVPTPSLQKRSETYLPTVFQVSP